MKELIEYIAKNIVDEPEHVNAVEVVKPNGNIEIQLSVAENDLGRIIGRRGSVARNIRTILKAISLKKNTNYFLKIIEND